MEHAPHEHIPEDAVFVALDDGRIVWAVGATPNGEPSTREAYEAANLIDDEPDYGVGLRYPIGVHYLAGRHLDGADRDVRYHLKLTGIKKGAMFHVSVNGYAGGTKDEMDRYQMIDLSIAAWFKPDEGPLRVVPHDRSIDAQDGFRDMKLAAYYIEESDTVVVAFNASNYFPTFRVDGLRMGYWAQRQNSGLEVVVTETNIGEIGA